MSVFPTTKAILFDVTGVLAIGPRFSTALERELGVSLDQQEQFFKGKFQPCLVGQADLKEVIDPFLEEWGWSKTVDALLKHWFETEDVPNKELIDIVPRLQVAGISCYLATNQEKYRSFYLHEQMGFGQLMDYCFFSYELKAKKPQGKYWQYIWDSLQYMADIEDKSQVMLWDDTQSNIDAASDFGFDSHLFESNQQFTQTMQQLQLL